MIGLLRRFIFYISILIEKIPAQTVALFSYIDPIVAVLLSVLVLKEELSTLGLIGIIMVLGSALISEIDFSDKLI